ncbi:MAG: cobaltochelatase subunit CobN [Pseudomonadota bacterium]
MHDIFRESTDLDAADTPVDLRQSPADLVVLSFSDSDLGAFAEAWYQGSGREGRLPSLRLANLAALTHPLSVDIYLEQTLAEAKGILIRLIGGVPYWSYGLQQVFELAKRKGIALAVLPADGRTDPRLDAYATLPTSTLRRLAHLCDNGGAVAAQAALAQLALAAGLYAGPVRGSKTVPRVGAWTPDHGLACPLVAEPRDPARHRVAVVFYRSYLVSADLAAIEALFAGFRARGYAPLGLFVPSLKDPEAAGWLRRQISLLAPAAIVNATAFSGQGAAGTSPLDAEGVPVFQVALSTSRREAWEGSERGLSPADLAMHVVLPEVDGRLFAGAISFKEPGVRDIDLQFARTTHRPDPTLIASVVDRVDGWVRLSAKPRSARKVALVLSTYPGKTWNLGHAVGLDAPASARAILEDLAGAGYDVELGTEGPTQQLGASQLRWPVAEYIARLGTLPRTMREALQTVWGAPDADPDVLDGAFQFKIRRLGGTLLALQPERGVAKTREDEYHDRSRVPRHAYVAFYLWMQDQADALVHIGAHGTLEWLPGKSVALSDECWPQALTGALPVIYPFIVNDPGEASQAKRRIGAVTLGHIPPPLRPSETPNKLVRLEALLDEFSNADGLDPKRRDRLQVDIRNEAQALGIENSLGLAHAAGPAEAINRIDRFVCDVKESQYGEGLHIFGRAPRSTQSAGASMDVGTAAAFERIAILDALDGKRIPAGPSGSPYRGRRDVLPTGRNMYATDPRAVPTRAAYTQGQKLAEDLLRRHLQDEGDWPQAMVIDLWGSATMRTAGEEFAMALHLIGVLPRWDEGSERVSGFDIRPLGSLGRPRIDVTLRVSGLFRDVFAPLSTLFGQAVRALAQRDEPSAENPFVGREDGARVYGPAPGSYGIGMGGILESYGPTGLTAAGEAWLAASAWSLDGHKPSRDETGIRDRVRAADSFVHVQDLPETDLLLAADYAAHEAGFAAAQSVVGGNANLYHLDSTVPERPRTRSLPEEIGRVVHARAAHPGWIAGMRAHGFRGAAEIAATLEHMAAFAHLAGAVSPELFDLYYDATLGDPQTDGFLAEANPHAREAMQQRFAALQDAGLWRTRRNSIMARMDMVSGGTG